MKAKMRRMLSVVMTLALALSVLVIPAVPAYASDTGEPDVMYICGSDCTAAEIKEVFLYHADTYSIYEDAVYDPKWLGMSFDAKTGTLTFNNVNAPGAYMIIDARGPITLKVEGTNKFGQLDCQGVSRLTVTGTGSLELNAPFTGKFSDRYGSGETTTLSNESPFYYGLNVTYNTWSLDSSFSLPMLVIGDQVTLKLNGKKVSSSGSSSSGSSSEPCCANFSFCTASKNVESKIIQHNSTETPAVKWNSYYIPNEMNFGSNTEKEFINNIDIPKEYLYIENPTISGNTATVTGEDIKDYVMYKSDIYVYRMSQKDGKWFIEEKSDGFAKYNTREVTADDMAVLAGSNTAKSLKTYAALEWGLSGAKLKKGNDTYIAARANCLYPSRVYENLLKINDDDGWYHFNYYIAKVTEKEDAIYLENTTELPNVNEDDFLNVLTKDGYVFEGSYAAHCSIANVSQTFAPKSSGSSAAALAPKVGDTDTTGNYTVTGNKEVEYTGKNAAGQKDVKIDSTVKVNGVDCTVNAIADNAFAGNKTMETVSIPETVSEIGDGAFKNCEKLKKADIPANTEEIGKDAFSGCKSMTAVNFKGQKVKVIGDNAFAKCSKLSKVTLPDSVTKIGKNAFSNDKKLKSITIGGSIKSVGKNAFKGVKNKAKVIIKTKKAKTYKKIVNMIKKAGNKKLSFSQKKK